MRKEDGDDFMKVFSRKVAGKGDADQSFPQSDADDFKKGLKFVPGEVTLARRRGERVAFHQPCRNVCCWYWLFPNGDTSRYWERYHFELYCGDSDNRVCQFCGNRNVMGGFVKECDLL